MVGCRTSPPPGALQNVHPVLVAELAQGGLVITMPAHGIHQTRQAAHLSIELNGQTRLDELASLEESADAVAATALDRGLDPDEAAEIERVLGRLEAALRARSAAGFG